MKKFTGVVLIISMLFALALMPAQTAGEGESTYPAEGDWVFSDPVLIIAESVGKTYDGQPLNSVNAQVTGLPDDFIIKVGLTGSQTDAGASVNTVSFYSISNTSGEEVTPHFTNIQTKEGQLAVAPAPLTVWTSDAWKYFDGNPLVCYKARIGTAAGNKSKGPAWKNTVLALCAENGTMQAVGLSGQTRIQTINPLNGDIIAAELTAGQALTVRTDETEDGLCPVLEVVPLKEDELPETVLRIYAENPELLAAACTEAGWDPQVMAARTEAVGRAENSAISETGLSVPADMMEQVITNAAGITFSTVSGTVSFNQVVMIDSSIGVWVTGTLTEVGRIRNGYRVNWGSANPANYILNEEFGILAVLENPATPTDLVAGER